MTAAVPFVALLRGINVGAAGRGRKSVPMAELRALAAELGFGDLRTYIQSGNLLFTAKGSAAAAERQLEAAIAARFGCDVPVIVRPARELVAAAARCPFADADTRPNLVHVGFAKGRISKTAAAMAAPYCTAGERVVVQGQVLWADYPAGVARSKLTPAVLDRAFGSPVTLRNMKTLRAIAGLVPPGR